MVRKQGPRVLLLTLALLAWTTSSFAASGGFRIFASDAEIMGKGSAFTGEADNPAAIVYNPAGLTQLKGANHMSVGFAAIQPLTEHTSTAGVTTQARINTFWVPHVYFVSDLGLDKVVFGIGSTSNFGLATDWARDSFSAYSATKTEVENMDNYITLSYEVNEMFSIGIGSIIEKSKLNKEKQIYQTPGTDANGQVKGDDMGYGYTLSGLMKLNDQHQFGLMYRSAIDLKYEGDVTADNLNNLGSTPYNAVFGGASYKTAFKGDFTLPQSVVLGYSFTPNDKWRLNFDMEWMDWSAIESETLSFPNETDATRLTILKALTNSDRDWESTLSYSAGAEYNWSDKLRLRGGYFYNPSPIPDKNFDTSVPISDNHGINAGFGYDLREDLTLDMAYTGMFYTDRTVDTTFGAALGATLDGTYKNFVNLATATLSYVF